MINSPIALLDDPDNPSLVALHLLNVLAIGSGLLPGNVALQSFSLNIIPFVRLATIHVENKAPLPWQADEQTS